MAVKLEDFQQLSTKLYSAVVADILDSLNYKNQVMDHNIQLFHKDEGTVLVGRAFTVLACDVYEDPEKPYAKLIQALDSLGTGELFVVTTNGSNRAAFWGELLSTASEAAGVRGAVVDGLTRDSVKIKKMGFPVFTKGFVSSDSKGRLDVLDYQTSIICGGELVLPGDLIIADFDGITVIPKEVEDQVIEKALEKVAGENLVRDELRQGVKCSAVFAKYGIL